MSPKAGNKKVEERHTPLDLFGSMIRVIREKKTIPLEELAKKAKISVETWEKIEAGSATLDETIKALPWIAFALRVNPRTMSKVFWRFIF